MASASTYLRPRDVGEQIDNMLKAAMRRTSDPALRRWLRRLMADKTARTLPAPRRRRRRQAVGQTDYFLGD
jgi:hypothetical protein